MTEREKTIWKIVGLAVLLMLGYNFCCRYFFNPGITPPNKAVLSETRRLLRSKRNIIARNRAVTAGLNEARDYFLDGSDPEAAKISLLQEVEKLAGRCMLPVTQKNIVSLSENTIGITVEGTAGAGIIIRFLKECSESKPALILKRLQLHAVPETKELNYQVIVYSLLEGREKPE